MGDPVTYTYEVKPESYYEAVLAQLDQRFSGYQAGVVLDPATVATAVIEPKQEYDESGRPVGPAIDPRWNPKAQYKPAKKVLGQQACRGRNYGRGVCKHCKDDYQKTKGNQDYCGKGGCQKASRQSSRDKKEADRRAYRAARPDCPHSVTVRKSMTHNRCQLCGRSVKI